MQSSVTLIRRFAHLVSQSPRGSRRPHVDRVPAVDLDAAARLERLDRAHVWHPYSSVLDPLPAFTVESAHGTRLTLADGRELVDGMSSWWAAIHGYNHPVLNAAAHAQ